MPVASIPPCLAADQQGVAFRGPVRYPAPAYHDIRVRLLAFRASQLENVAAEDEQPAAQCGEVGIGWEVVSRRSFNA